MAASARGFTYKTSADASTSACTLPATSYPSPATRHFFPVKSRKTGKRKFMSFETLSLSGNRSAYAGKLPVPRLYLIDTFGFIFRAYHARARSGAPPMRTATGLSTEAVFIFHNMLRKLLATSKPDYIAAIFESTEPTFRSTQFAEYKANRTEMPPDL